MNTPTNPHTTHIATRRNLKSGSKVAAETTRAEAASWAGRWSNLAADHTKRWERRLYVPKSGGVELGKLAVRLQHLGQRDEFRFDTTNRAAAAVRALDVFRHLKANGWEATRARFKPQGEPKLDLTVGDYLAAVDGTRRLRPRTFLNYRNCFHTIVAEVFGVRPRKGESKFDYRAGGNRTWLQRLDEIRLERLTPDKVTGWKRERLKTAGTSPAAIASARRTVNSYVRCARSLFSPALVRELKGLKLPGPLPFAGVELEESGSQKYVSKISAPVLIAAAKNDLKAADPEAYKAFLLGLFAGMRKAEIDSAEWRMVDFAAKVIRLEETEVLHLKTRDAAAEITVDPEVIAELRAMMPAPTDKPAPWSQFILQSHRPPKPESLRPYYRAEETFARLNAWLRGEGVRANKPLHELRKELGAIIATEHGIFAASKFLRHSDITTTARHYADQKARINVGLGKFLDTSIKVVPQAAQAAAA